MTDTVRWRVRRQPLPWWKRSFDRTLAQADVHAPDGSDYLVRVVRNLPFRDSPLERVDDLLPGPVALAVLVGANLFTRGRTGWTVQILRPATKWRHARVIYDEKSRVFAYVSEIAASLTDRISRGEQPWAAEVKVHPVVRFIQRRVRLF